MDFSFSLFVIWRQIFGDYYHFQHRKVAKRSTEPGIFHDQLLNSDPAVSDDQQFMLGDVTVFLSYRINFAFCICFRFGGCNSRSSRDASSGILSIWIHQKVLADGSDRGVTAAVPHAVPDSVRHALSATISTIHDGLKCGTWYVDALSDPAQ